MYAIIDALMALGSVVYKRNNKYEALSIERLCLVYALFISLTVVNGLVPISTQGWHEAPTPGRT